MSIKKLTVRNIKKISFAEIEPDSSVVEVHGKNAQGKTSILQAILMALGGKKEFGSLPIKEGEDRAEIVVESDEMKVVRKIKKNERGDIDTELMVMDTTGNIVKRPQEFLNNALGSAMLDPTEFVSMSAKERRLALQEALGIKEEFDKLDMERGRIYQERTQLGREDQAVLGRLMEYDDLGDEDIDEKTNQNDIDEVMRKSAEIDNLLERERNAAEIEREAREALDEQRKKLHSSQDRTENHRDILKDCKTTVKRIEAELEEMKKEVRQAEKDLERVEIAEAKEREELDRMSKGMSQGYTVPKEKIEEQHNLKERLRELVQNTKDNERRSFKRKLQSEHRGMLDRLKGHTNQIKAIDEKKKELLRSTPFPVPGMAFGEDDIEMNGVPFTSSSTAEQILMSVVINSAIDNELKIMRIPDGSMLDDSAIGKLRQIADDKGLQIWIETVSRVEKDNVLIIEEGRIK